MSSEHKTDSQCPVFIPPYPKPHKNKLSRGLRFVQGWRSWIHTVAEKSYRMKMGEIRLPGIRFVIPNTIPLARQILDNPLQFPKHKLLHQGLEPLIGDSVFSINGKAWQEARAMVNPAFAHTHLKRSFPTMQQGVEDMMARIARHDMRKPAMIDPWMTHVTADIIFRAILSRSLDEQGALQIYQAFETYQLHGQRCMILRTYGLPYGIFERLLLKAADSIHAVFDPIVKQRHAAFMRGEDAHQDILHELMKAKHPSTGEPFTPKELIDQVGIIFLAGHETTASALSWSLYLMASCPHVQEQAYQEAEANWPLTADKVRHMDIIRNVFRETMRLYPPVSFLMRQVEEPTPMQQKTIMPDDLVLVSPWLMQRNEDHFPCPHAFMPDRFADPAQAESCKEAYFPFGRGPRICIGAGFAQQEASLVLSTIIKHYRLSTVAGKVPQPVSRLTLRAKKGIHLRLTPR
jgi:cytochrome P450